MRVIDDLKRRVSERGLATFAAVSLAIAAACSGTTATVWTTSDLYAYDYYYPADIAYYDTYWVDSWYADPYYYLVTSRAQTYTADGGATPDAGAIADGGATSDASTGADGGTSGQGLTGVAAVLRALAQGEMVCPGQVTVVPKTTQLCSLAGGPGTVRSGATITFNGCMLSGGGRIDGMIDSTSMPTASDNNCDANTTINVSYTTTYTNLSYRAPSGTRVVIPSQTDKGSYMRKSTAGPTAISISSNGSLQRYDASNALVSNHTYNGMRNFTISRPNNVLTYMVSGTLMVQDAAGGSAVSVTGNDITRTAACCRPTGGTLSLTRDETSANWTFGPMCGQATANGTSVTLPACE
jgi:hypothetical protein